MTMKIIKCPVCSGDLKFGAYEKMCPKCRVQYVEKGASQIVVAPVIGQGVLLKGYLNGMTILVEVNAKEIEHAPVNVIPMSVLEQRAKDVEYAMDAWVETVVPIDD
ncbi:MAG: hypothetical protein DRJ03_07205 [Chloroflexi bacterium]|nr:MAG: hypothetical protein DRJ03_07205 [Chloroflexota bacterium]